MKKKRTVKQIISYVFLIIFIIFCIGLGIYNFITNDKFFETPITTIVSIFSAVVISFFIVQRKTDDRRKKEKIDKLLYKIQDTILDDKFLNVKEDDLIKHRSIANKIEYVRENADDNIMEDVKKIQESFQEFRDFYSNHYTDEDYMKKSTKELTNYISLIDDRCDKIHMKLM